MTLTPVGDSCHLSGSPPAPGAYTVDVTLADGTGTSVRRWFDTVLFEHAADGRVRDVVADVGQRALDPIVAQGWILFRESKNRVDDFLTDARSTLLAAI